MYFINCLNESKLIQLNKYRVQNVNTDEAVKHQMCTTGECTCELGLLSTVSAVVCKKTKIMILCF